MNLPRWYSKLYLEVQDLDWIAIEWPKIRRELHCRRDQAVNKLDGIAKGAKGDQRDLRLAFQKTEALGIVREYKRWCMAHVARKTRKALEPAQRYANEHPELWLVTYPNWEKKLRAADIKTIPCKSTFRRWNPKIKT